MSIRTTPLLLAMTLSCLFAPSALAAESSTPGTRLAPYGSEAPLIAKPHVEKKTLANGLQVWVVERKGLPRVDYVLAVRGAGLAADEKQHAGFAQLLAGMLNEGTVKRDARAVAEAAEAFGGSVSASASRDAISISGNAPTANASTLLQLLAEVARQPAFPPGEVELAKNNALEALRAPEAPARPRAERAPGKMIFADPPYANNSPTAQAISAMTPETLRAEHGRRFRPERSVLVVTGRISALDAVKLATAAFGDWRAGGEPLAAQRPSSWLAEPAPALTVNH